MANPRHGASRPSVGRPTLRGAMRGFARALDQHNAVAACIPVTRHGVAQLLDAVASVDRHGMSGCVV
ncbi:hypothetical protein E2562_025284 [Oryza meyeriana var. granulata]|uniref:Uncharacterized protein n=1 Tax=Oryza meyeriana var. granulata TaxID=110450 RepID=A0A6G1BNR6_9ORYZ|nr:hypothetical protein E2562_025284 [Oryza meyeriana var. granulata]